MKTEKGRASIAGDRLRGLEVEIGLGLSSEISREIRYVVLRREKIGLAKLVTLLFCVFPEVESADIARSLLQLRKAGFLAVELDAEQSMVRCLHG